METQRLPEKLGSSLTHHVLWLLDYYILPHHPGAFHEINKRVSELPKISFGRHLFGSVEWCYNGKAIGHMHGNRVVDILFPKEIQQCILSAGKAKQNKYVPYGISVFIRKPEDVDYALTLLIQSYQLVKQRDHK